VRAAKDKYREVREQFYPSLIESFHVLRAAYNAAIKATYRTFVQEQLATTPGLGRRRSVSRSRSAFPASLWSSSTRWPSGMSRAQGRRTRNILDEDSNPGHWPLALVALVTLVTLVKSTSARRRVPGSGSR